VKGPLPPISIYGYIGGRQIYALCAFVRVGKATFLSQSIDFSIFFKNENCGCHSFWRLGGRGKLICQSIGITENNTLPLKFYFLS